MSKSGRHPAHSSYSHSLPSGEHERKIAPRLENHANIPAVSRPDTVSPSDVDLAGTLHEVSNALTVVLGWVAEARDKLPPGEVRDALEIAYSHAHRGHSAARRAIDGRDEAESSARSSESLVTDAVFAASREADKRRVVLRHDEGERDECVDHADAVLQILVNLLLNAIAFSPEDGVVSVSCQSTPGFVVFRITDEGPGVPTVQRSSLFTRGQSMRPGGAGIGLSYSHGLADKHGGSLRLLPSEKGAAFELSWPVSEAPSRTSQRVPPASVLNGMKVLVLEDDAAVMAMIQMGFAARGIEVIPAGDVHELTALAQRGASYDAAFIDLSPIADDPQRALSLVRQGRSDVPVILISGSALPPQAQLDYSSWVHKPFEVAELCRALSATCPAG